MPNKYVIAKVSNHRSAYSLHAEYANGTRELICYFLYRIGARRMGQELQRLAPAVALIDQTLARKGVDNGR